MFTLYIPCLGLALLYLVIQFFAVRVIIKFSSVQFRDIRVTISRRDRDVQKTPQDRGIDLSEVP